MRVPVICLYCLSVFLLELLYFKIALKYNIIDRPNHRSSHTVPTIRGGGIIFSVSIILSLILIHLENAYFLTGIFLISLISFIDDVKSVPNKVRILFHTISVALLFYQVHLFSSSILYVGVAFFLAIGIINAFNFMDGINGITGGYGLLTVITLSYINAWVIHFLDDSYFIVVIVPLLVFNFFNFRTKAKCFAGDVGSVSLAFAIIYPLFMLVLKTNNINYWLILLFYGLDVLTTMIWRAIKKENIFEAHKKHFYQFLANQLRISHLQVAAIYVCVQGVWSVVLLKYLIRDSYLPIIVAVVLTLVFIAIRIILEGTTIFIKKPV